MIIGILYTGDSKIYYIINNIWLSRKDEVHSI